jgi:2-methylcitrate dehydratase PrpD
VITPLTRELARQTTQFRYADLDQFLQLRARMGVLDFLGVALAGSREALAQIMGQTLADAGGSAQASVIGTSWRVPVANAAMLNGAAGHALDYDDVSLALSGHPSAAVLPAALALGEHLQCSGQDLAEAYVAGFEAACRVGRLLMPSSQDLGFHLTGVAGVFGAAAAASRLLRLDVEQTAMAFGIASSQAAGLRVEGGTMCKPLHAGRAAEAGVLAARLAQRGFTARADALECDRGFLHAFSRRDAGNADDEIMSGGARYFEGSIFKFHAACFFVHSAIECGRLAAVQTGFAVPSAVSLWVHPETVEACSYMAPVNDLESKRSLTHAVALGILDKRSDDPDCFGQATLADPAVVEIRGKVTVVADESVSKTGAQLWMTTVAGMTVGTAHDASAPSRLDAPTISRLNAKFLALATPVLGCKRAQALAAAVGGLQELDDVGALMTAARVPAEAQDHQARTTLHS